MNIGEIIILGLVQGLTEFLPVSSSGHLIAARILFRFSDLEGNAFDAFLHLGTLLAVLVYYWRVWWGIACSIIKNDAESVDKRQLAAKLALATVPAATIGYFFQGYVAGIFRSSTSVAFGLTITAVAFMATEVLAKRVTTITRASFLDAIIIGFAQILALLPGISRSGITIVAGRSRGLSRKQAASFSFLLSAPIIAGAGLASMGSIVGTGVFAPGQLILGLIVSFLGGLTAIHLLLKIVEKISFWPFAIYLIGLAGVLFFFG